MLKHNLLAYNLISVTGLAFLAVLRSGITGIEDYYNRDQPNTILTRPFSYKNLSRGLFILGISFIPEAHCPVGFHTQVKQDTVSSQ